MQYRCQCIHTHIDSGRRQPTPALLVTPLTPWHPARVGDVCHWWRRATVTAAGAVKFWDDDGSAWLAENGV
jgi:hypothetical protein